MADDRTTTRDEGAGATPPGAGRQSIGTQEAAKHRRISGPGASDVLAASGGLDLPGTSAGEDRDTIARVEHLAGSVRPDLDTPAQAITPGELDPSTATTGTQTGTMGGGGPDAHTLSPVRALDDDDPELAEERRREGGGGARQRPREGHGGRQD